MLLLLESGDTIISPTILTLMSALPTTGANIDLSTMATVEATIDETGIYSKYSIKDAARSSTLDTSSMTLPLSLILC